MLSGLQHPVSGLDHVLAMVAVGLWGAQLGAPAIWLLPVTFPLVMAFGGLLGLLGVPLPGVEVGIAASAIVLGAMVAAESRPPLLGSPPCWSASSRIFHGHAHGTELPAGQSGLLYSMGFVVATGVPARGRHRASAWSTAGRGRIALRGAGARSRRPALSSSGGRWRERGDAHRDRGLPALALLLPPAAQAHLVSTGIGPVYDGMSHFVLTPEDLLPVLAMALLAGLNGAGRPLVLFVLPVAWLAGGLAGLLGRRTRRSRPCRSCRSSCSAGSWPPDVWLPLAGVIAPRCPARTRPRLPERRGDVRREAAARPD